MGGGDGTNKLSEKIVAGMAVLGFVMAIAALVWNGGGTSARMQTEIDNNRAAILTKEDISAAEAHYQGEIDEIKALAAQQQIIIQMLANRRGQ